MLLLILGVLIWAGAHLFRRLAPEKRAAMGDKGRGLVALGVVLGLVLMVIGYRMADGAFVWGRSPALVGINNLLMLFAVYCFAASGMKTRLTSKIRHPQLTGVKTWAIAHLLVNGDTPSFVLFGGMLAWAVVEVILAGKSGPWVKPTGPFPPRKEVMAILGTVVVYAAIAGIHYAFGYPTFG